METHAARPVDLRRDDVALMAVNGIKAIEDGAFAKLKGGYINLPKPPATTLLRTIEIR